MWSGRWMNKNLCSIWRLEMLLLLKMVRQRRVKSLSDTDPPHLHCSSHLYCLHIKVRWGAFPALLFPFPILLQSGVNEFGWLKGFNMVPLTACKPARMIMTVLAEDKRSLALLSTSQPASAISTFGFNVSKSAFQSRWRSDHDSLSSADKLQQRRTAGF